MEIRLLKYFLTVVHEESITRASQVLHITQPTLSRQLMQLEKDLNTKLFHRGTRKISLTNEGFLFRRRAEEILELVNKTKKDISKQNNILSGTISLSCGEFKSVSLLTKILSSFSQKYPLVTFDLFTANANQTKELLDKGIVDIGLLLEPENIEKYNYIRFPIKERWVVILPTDDDLAKQKYITAKDLLKYPIILPKRINARNELINWFGNKFENLKVKAISNMSTNASIMVQNKLGYALVIEGSVPINNEKICYRPIYPELLTTCVLIWKRQQPFNLATTKFLEYISCFLGMKNS